MNRGGREFEDLSALSGLDHVADGRAFATLDLDRDGRLDVVVANKNAPSLLLYRNEVERAGHFVAFRFVGGNVGPEPAGGPGGWSARDGYGAVVSLSVGGAELEREHRCGEGLAAQNGATLVVGVGEALRVDAARVRWPSGRVQETADLPAGTLVTVYEDPARSPTGEAFVREPYAAGVVPAAPAAPIERGPRLLAGLAPPGNGDDPAAPELRMLTTMATWCASCRRELPQLALLRSAFPPSTLAMLGVPVDEKDTPERLAAYQDAYRPPYELLADLPPERVAEVRAAVVEALGVEGLPATVLTDGEGRVLRVMWGVPTISEVRRLLDQRGP